MFLPQAIAAVRTIRELIDHQARARGRGCLLISPETGPNPDFQGTAAGSCDRLPGC